MTTRASLATRAEAVPLGEMGHGGQDPRSGEQYGRDLEREAEVSLRRDPSRWRHGHAADRDEYRAKPRRPTGRRAEP
jgi:hypothetical protein